MNELSIFRAKKPKKKNKKQEKKQEKKQKIEEYIHPYTIGDAMKDQGVIK